MIDAPRDNGLEPVIDVSQIETSTGGLMPVLLPTGDAHPHGGTPVI
jgi:hypothetical protein